MATVLACLIVANAIMFFFLWMAWVGARIQAKHFVEASDLYCELAALLDPIAIRSESREAFELVEKLKTSAKKVKLNSLMGTTDV